MILVDGIRCDHVPADDRGLAYGDGLFETLRAVNGRLPLLDWHLERLIEGCKALRLPHPDLDELSRELLLVAAYADEGKTEAVVKLILTRGSGSRGYATPAHVTLRRIVKGAELPPHIALWRREGIVLRHCETRVDGPDALAGLKHLNRLSQVLARAEWNDPEIHEGLMRDAEGHVAEGTMSNLFVVQNDRLLTPPVGKGVRGIMRRFVCALAEAAGIEWQERVLNDAEIGQADEIFVSNSLLGVCPVRRIDRREYTIGTITRRLQADVERELERRACFDD